MPRTADTRLGLGVPSPETTDISLFIPPVKARLDTLLSGGTVNAEGIWQPDEFRVVATKKIDGSKYIYPELIDPEFTDIYFGSNHTMLYVETATVNNMPTAKRIIPTQPIPFYMNNRESGNFFRGQATQVRSLLGEYEPPTGLKMSVSRLSVAIHILDFSDGSLKIFFPYRVGAYPLPDSEKVELVRQLGAKVQFPLKKNILL